MSTRADTQRLLWELITAPEGVGAALALDADRGGTLASRLAQSVRSDGALDAVQRLDVYANMYFFRILDVLAETYPATRALLGAQAFHNLVTDYLLRYPPAHFSIRRAGRHLPAQLAHHDARRRHPCVRDLARLERALLEAFDAADPPALRSPSLAVIAPERWENLRFRLHPSVRFLRCGWPVHRIRAAVDRGEPIDEPARDLTRLCVWRRDLVVHHRQLSRGEFAALQAIARSKPFAEVCAAASVEANPSDGAAWMAGALARWIADGWLASARLGD